MNPLLLVLLLPVAAIVTLLFLAADAKKAIRAVATVATGLALATSVLLFLGFNDVTYVEGDPPVEAFTANAGEADEHVYKYGFEQPWIPTMGLAFRLGVDGMGMAMVLLTLLVVFAAVLVSYRIETRVKAYYICLLTLATGVLGVFMSLDLFFYYFFYELAAIPLFLLIGIWGSTRTTVDRGYAAVKLVLLPSAGAVIALVGLIAVWSDAGTFNMVALEEHEFGKSFQMIWFPLVFLGFAALVPVWPLHTASPAGHAAAPTAVSMLHAGVLTKLGAFGILRIACTYFPLAAVEYLPFVGFLCCVNILYGGLVAIAQRDLKLIIGYSATSHMGFVLLGIASMTLIGLEGAVFVMFAHGVLMALVFALIGWLDDQAKTRELDDLGGLLKVMPFAGTCFILAAVACAGLPGFAHFAGALMVIIGAWEHAVAPGSPARLFIPAILAMWGLVITAIYLLRAVRDLWFGAMDPRWQNLKDQRSLAERAPALLLVGALLCFGLLPQTLIAVVEQGVKPLHVRIEEGKTQDDRAVDLERIAEPRPASGQAAAQAGEVR